MRMSVVKTVVFFTGVLFSAQGFADHHNKTKVKISTPGMIHYELRDEVVSRSVILHKEQSGTVGPMFKLSAGDWQISSSDHFTKEKRGANVAYVVFKDAWDYQGEKTHLLFKGSKLKTEARMIYHGNIYKIKDSQLLAKGETLEDCVSKLKVEGVFDEDWEFAGVFSFDRTSELRLPVLP